MGLDSNFAHGTGGAKAFQILDGIIAACISSAQYASSVGKVPTADTYLSIGKRLGALLSSEVLLVAAFGKVGTIECSSTAALHDAAALCRAWLEVLLDHEPSWIRFPIQHLLAPLLRARHWPVEEFLGRAKYATAWPYARFLKNDPPPCKYADLEMDLRFWGTGPLLKVLKNRLNAFTKLNNHLWWSQLQGVKRGCAPARDVHIGASLSDHACVMGTSPANPLTDDFVEKFKYRLERFGAHVFHDKLDGPRKTTVVKLLNKDDLPPIEPTTGASWEYNCCKTTREGLFEDVTGADWIHHPSTLAKQVEKWHKKVYDKSGATLPEAKQKCSPAMAAAEIRDLIYKAVLPALGLNTDLDKMVEVRPGVVREIRTYMPVVDLPELYSKFAHKSVKIIPLCEPLKIRTISKGNCANYWSSRTVQRLMWKKVQSITPCTLIGEPLQQRHLTDLVERTRSIALKAGLPAEFFTHWVSGDFKGATDYLDIRLTKIVFEFFLARLKPSEDEEAYATNPDWDWLISRLRDVIYEQKLVYEHVAFEAEVMQANGQLMGSPLSFPILCLINLLCYWINLEDQLEILVPVEELPVLVNGDDILFMSPAPDLPFYEGWKDSITAAGFRLSIGKNYIHHTVLTVNSENWWWNGSYTEPSFHRTKHLDVGLLQNDNSAQRLENRTLPLAERLQRVLEGAHAKQRAWNRLRHYYLKEIKQWTQEGKYNVFASLQAGGLGVTRPPELEVHYTNFQKRFAGWMRHHLDSFTTLDDASVETLKLQVTKEPTYYGQPVCRYHNYKVKWHSREQADLLTEEDPGLVIAIDEVKSSRFLPDKLVLGACNASYTMKTRKGFHKAFKACVVPKGNPEAPDRILLRDFQRVAALLPKSHSEPSPEREARTEGLQTARVRRISGRSVSSDEQSVRSTALGRNGCRHHAS